MNSGIYKILNTKNNKFYIGSSKNIIERISIHKSLLRNNKHDNSYLQNAYNKYSGWFFEFIVLEYCEPNFRIEREQYYIDTLKPEYNLAPKANGMLDYNHTEKTKLKMSLSHTGKKKSKISIEKTRQAHIGSKRSSESRARMSAWQIGRKMSDEAKQNMSKAKKGIPKSKEHKLKISLALKGRKLSEDHIIKTRRKSQRQPLFLEG